MLELLPVIVLDRDLPGMDHCSTETLQSSKIKYFNFYSINLILNKGASIIKLMTLMILIEEWSLQ